MHEVLGTDIYPQKDSELKRLFEQYITECMYTKRLSKKTIKGYQEVFSTFQKIVPEVTALNELNSQSIAEFFKRISVRKRVIAKQVLIGVKVSTTSTYYNKLMAFIRWLELNDYLKKGSVSEKVPKPPIPKYTDERALSPDEVFNFSTAIDTHQSKDMLALKRDQAIISILIYSGLRRGELLGLKVKDVNFESNMIFVNHLTSKSRYDRYIPMHPKLKSILIAYLTERRQRGITCEALIVSYRRQTAFTEHGMKHWVKKYKKLSGVAFHLHRCRHTFACNLAKAGADVTTIMKLLGHTTIRMTERYLRSIKTEDSRVYIEKLPF